MPCAPRAAIFGIPRSFLAIAMSLAEDDASGDPRGIDGFDSGGGFAAAAERTLRFDIKSRPAETALPLPCQVSVTGERIRSAARRLPGLPGCATTIRF